MKTCHNYRILLGPFILPSNMILQKYENIFREINLDTEKFNALLAEEFRIAQLSASNSESCAVVANIAWNDQV
jgi:hypothetical protein